MKYMLDTNICIYFMKGVATVTAAFQEKRQFGISISTVVLSELHYGVLHSKSREKNNIRLMSFLELVDVLPYDKNAAYEYGDICAALRREGNTIGYMDMLIAAHARAQGMILVTNNMREFARVERLHTENWAVIK